MGRMFLIRFLFNSIRFGFRLGLAGLFAIAIGLVAYTFFWLPDVTFLKDTNPETTAFMEQARARYRSAGMKTQIHHSWVQLEKISPDLVDAVLIAEDARFFNHRGFDLIEIRRSIEENFRKMRWARGGSSLTQQLAKNLFLTPKKSLKRKFDEMLITWKLEATLSKNRILELYLNVVDWGGNCFGIQEAAQFYFSKNASELEDKEAASLAARLPNPDLLNSRDGEARRRNREAMILEGMKGTRPGELRGKTLIARKAKQKSENRAISVSRTLEPSTATQEIVKQVAEIGSSFKDRLGDVVKKLDQIQIQPLQILPEEPPRSMAQKMNPPETSPEVKKEAPQAGWKPLSAPPSRVEGATREEKIARSGSIEPVKSPDSEKAKPNDNQARSRRVKESLNRLERVVGP